MGPVFEIGHGLADTGTDTDTSYWLGNAGTRAVSMILEYSMDTLPARSILVALPGSA
jgi:hypothetical protein